MKILPEDLFLCIAGFKVRIMFYTTQWKYAYETLYKQIKQTYSGFNIDDSIRADFKINVIETISLKSIVKGENKYHYSGLFYYEGKREITTFYQISILQFQLIIREIIQILLSTDSGFILHASASCYNNGAYIFAGQSGAGKSTAMSLIAPVFTPLADDTVIIKIEEGKSYLYQTPFIEKNSWIKKNKMRYPVKAIFFLVQSKKFQVKKLKDKEIITKYILKQFWSDEDGYKRQVDSLLQFISQLSNCYFLYFAKNKSKLRNLLIRL